MATSRPINWAPECGPQRKPESPPQNYSFGLRLGYYLRTWRKRSGARQQMKLLHISWSRTGGLNYAKGPLRCNPEAPLKRKWILQSQNLPIYACPVRSKVICRTRQLLKSYETRKFFQKNSTIAHSAIFKNWFPLKKKHKTILKPFISKIVFVNIFIIKDKYCISFKKRVQSLYQKLRDSK